MQPLQECLLAPAGTPKAVIAQLSEDLRKAMQVPQVVEKFSLQGFTASWDTPEQFGRFLAAEIDKWTKTVKASGATLD